MFFIVSATDFAIVKDPINTTVFIGKFANLSCSSVGASANRIVPDWLVGKNNVLPTKRIYSGYEIVNKHVENIKWIPDLNTGTNGTLLVGPVDKNDNGSTYQCVFSFSDGSVYSKVAVLTVIGVGMYIYIAIHTVTQKLLTDLAKSYQSFSIQIVK